MHGARSLAARAIFFAIEFSQLVSAVEASRMNLTDRRTLPRSGLSLPMIGLGCAQLGGLYRPTDPAEANRLVAALQFPLAHPAVASCVTGVRNAGELVTNLVWLQAPIPAAFRQALKARGLLNEAAPVPVEG